MLKKQRMNFAHHLLEQRIRSFVRNHVCEIKQIPSFHYSQVHKYRLQPERKPLPVLLWLEYNCRLHQGYHRVQLRYKLLHRLILGVEYHYIFTIFHSPIRETPVCFKVNTSLSCFSFFCRN